MQISPVGGSNCHVKLWWLTLFPVRWYCNNITRTEAEQLLRQQVKKRFSHSHKKKIRTHKNKYQDRLRSHRLLKVFLCVLQDFIFFTNEMFSWNLTQTFSGCFQDKEGGFVVRESSQRGGYTVSVYTKTLRCFTSPHTASSSSCSQDKAFSEHLCVCVCVRVHACVCVCVCVRSPTGDIRHYQIKTTDSGLYYLAEKHTFSSIPDVIHYHEHNAAGTHTGHLEDAAAASYTSEN